MCGGPEKCRILILILCSWCLQWLWMLLHSCLYWCHYFSTSDRCSVSQRAGRRLLMTSQRWQSPPSLDQTRQLFFAQHWRLWWTTGTTEMDSNIWLFESRKKKKMKTRFILIGNHMFFLLSLIKGLKRNARRSTPPLPHPQSPRPHATPVWRDVRIAWDFPPSPSTFLSAKFLYLWHMTNLAKTCLHWSLKKKKIQHT